MGDCVSLCKCARMYLRTVYDFTKYLFVGVCVCSISFEYGLWMCSRFMVCLRSESVCVCVCPSCIWICVVSVRYVCLEYEVVCVCVKYRVLYSLCVFLRVFRLFGVSA